MQGFIDGGKRKLNTREKSSHANIAARGRGFLLIKESGAGEETVAALTALGWRVEVIWECEARKPQLTADLLALLGPGSPARD